MIGARSLRAATVIVALFVCITNAAIVYTGSLSSATGGINGAGGWITPGPTTLDWTVTQLSSGAWQYAYTLTVPDDQRDVSHMIIEASETFTVDDLLVTTGPFSMVEIKVHEGMSSGNPSMPEDTYGMKFDETYGTTVEIIIEALRTPVWGDFYAKCGAIPPNEAWNAGFADPDPLDLPDNGSINNHVLVPDTYVPEPATMLLLGCGSLALIRRRRS